MLVEDKGMEFPTPDAASNNTMNLNQHEFFVNLPTQTSSKKKTHQKSAVKVKVAPFQSLR